MAVYEKLYKSVSCTADYRFNTYRRLDSLEGVSNVALISASTALIVVSFILALYSKNLEHNEIYITIGQNCLPIIMLALSIMVSGAKYGARAERMHDCAQALIHLKKLLNFDIKDCAFSPSAENFKEYAARYHAIISKYENHGKIDLVIEGLRIEKKRFVPDIIIESVIVLVGRGVLYYLYLLISIMSVGWMVFVIHLVIEGAILC